MPVASGVGFLSKWEQGNGSYELDFIGSVGFINKIQVLSVLKSI